MNRDRDQQTATLLPDGHVLIAGGTTFRNHRATVQLYTP